MVIALFTKQSVLLHPTCPDSWNQINASLVHHFLGYLHFRSGHHVSSAPVVDVDGRTGGLQLGGAAGVVMNSTRGCGDL